MWYNLIKGSDRKVKKENTEATQITANKLIVGEQYNTIHGIAKYTGKKYRGTPITEDQSDIWIHVFEYLEHGRWEVPEARLYNVILVATEQPMTKMMMPETYLSESILGDE